MFWLSKFSDHICFGFPGFLITFVLAFQVFLSHFFWFSRFSGHNSFEFHSCLITFLLSSKVVWSHFCSVYDLIYFPGWSFSNKQESAQGKISSISLLLNVEVFAQICWYLFITILISNYCKKLLKFVVSQTWWYLLLHKFVK